MLYVITMNETYNIIPLWNSFKMSDYQTQNTIVWQR